MATYTDAHLLQFHVPRLLIIIKSQVLLHHNKTENNLEMILSRETRWSR
jgi:hypothetical protein